MGNTLRPWHVRLLKHLVIRVSSVAEEDWIDLSVGTGSPLAQAVVRCVEVGLEGGKGAKLVSLIHASVTITIRGVLWHEQ